MKRKFILIGVFAALMMSCENETHSDQDMEHHNHDVEHEDHKESEHSEEESASISLNNGEKWKVNEEMLPHIEKSEAVFQTFEGEDYNQLSEDMMLHTNNLIQSCTMDGASHDELHKWLHPHLELIKSMNNENAQEAKEEILPAIEKSFTTFHKYFQ